MSNASAAVPVLTVEEFLDQFPAKLQIASAGGQPFSVVVATYRTIEGFSKADWSDRVRSNLHGDTLTMRIGGYAGDSSAACCDFSALDPTAQKAVFERVYEIGSGNHQRPMLVVAYGGNDHLDRIWTHLNHVRHISAFSRSVFSRALLVCQCATGRMVLGQETWPWVKTRPEGPACLIKGLCQGDHTLGQITRALGQHLQIPLSA